MSSVYFQWPRKCERIMPSVCTVLAEGYYYIILFFILYYITLYCTIILLCDILYYVMFRCVALCYYYHITFILYNLNI